MRLRLLTAFALGLFSCLPGWGGGSRVGGGSSATVILGSDQSFQIETPVQFFPKRKTTNGFQLSGPPIVTTSPNSIFSGIQIKEQTIDVSDINVEAPELKKMSKEALMAWFKQKGYRSLPSESNCVLAKSVERNGLTTAMVTWGKGHGYAASVETNPIGNQGLETMVKSTKIFNGECDWK